MTQAGSGAYAARAGIADQERVARVPGPDDVVATALGYLDDRIPGYRADAAAFRDDPEGVRSVHRLAVDGQFLGLAQDDGHAARAD